ncbi:hypothetical protein SAMN05660337_0031 [Maridesulfovibrio ferrireducens]|uniref:Homoserine dehydrogenase, NAD binding domain n=1 Tax=Maridesulfovibrio ferrireducens TaxID=246191 RepID=A0A1G9AW71_9BACT|nr:hypothetical protein [Maridesulfovibrio ferrireducens]SDK30805.1 hypothetical protein SAMN05660337_0031 [Maridesulfovibrio ferrireducens]
MENHNIAIVGLGRVGAVFLEKVLNNDGALKIKSVCELTETAGKRLALEKGVPVGCIDDIVKLGVEIDVIFDFTGDEKVAEILRRKLAESGNNYTQVAQKRLARLVWALISEDECLPEVRSTKSQSYADMLLSQQE